MCDSQCDLYTSKSTFLNSQNWGGGGGGEGGRLILQCASTPVNMEYTIYIYNSVLKHFKTELNKFWLTVFLKVIACQMPIAVNAYM